MPAESFSVVSFLRLYRYICSHSSETYFLIEILKELPPRDWELMKIVLFISYYFSKN